MITPTELSRLREEVEKWESDTCDIYRRSIVGDDYGGEDDSGAEVLVASGVTCFIEVSPTREQIIELLVAQRKETIYMVGLPIGTDIQVDDHLVFTSRSNLHVRVISVLIPESLDIELMVAASSLGEHVT